MRMNAMEKHFVNSAGHTRQVAGRAQRLLEQIELQAGSRYLDVGCGVGATARAIAQRPGLDVTGIDVDPEQIEAAQSGEPHARARFMVMDAAKLQFPDAEFDIVASSMATHHMPGWEQAFSEMI